MYYTYALRGDGQVITRALTKQEQLKALNAVLDCMDPKQLILPDRIAQLIPPRPSGYNFTRELFKKRTGLAFDALAPAETAADFPLSFLFNSERVSRMVQYEAGGGLGTNEMINLLIEKTWKSVRRTGMEKLIQLQTEQLLLTYLLALSIDENANYAARAAAQKGLADLKKYIDEKKKTVTDELYMGHYALALERMKAPEKAKPTQHKEMPPGAPIGCDMED
jgi:Met-zincin